MHPFEKELKELSDTLQLAHDKATALPPAMGAVRIRLQNNVQLMQNFINGLAGGAMTTHEQPDSPPITSILGEEIKYRQPVMLEDVTPTNEEANKFLKERDELYAAFPTLSIDQINSKAHKPGGEPVIRAVAKKAGYEQYRDGKINKIYIDAVKKLMEIERELAQKIDAAENKVL